MALIVAILSLTIALVGVWLASTSMKKVDANADFLLQRMRSENRKEFDQIGSKLTSLEKRSGNFEAQLKLLTPEDGEKLFYAAKPENESSKAVA